MIANSSVVASDFFSRLRVQEAVFSAGLPAMLDAIGGLHDRVSPIPSAACGVRMQQALHTLAGCAPTFGYRRLAHEARALEQRLRVLQAFDNVPAVDWMTWFGQLDAMLAWARIAPRSCTTTVSQQ